MAKTVETKKTNALYATIKARVANKYPTWSEKKVATVAYNIFQKSIASAKAQA